MDSLLHQETGSRTDETTSLRLNESWSSFSSMDADELNALLGGSTEAPPPRKRNTRTSSHLDKFDKFQDDARKSTPLSRKLSASDLAMTATKVSRVEQSWYAVSGKIGEVGLKFFLRMFDEHPEIVSLFPFGEDSIDKKNGKLKLNGQTKAHVRAHAIAVMRVVGSCVAGLTKMEDLIPRLRNVGETHKNIGVQPIHYDILYRHMVRAIREELGPEKWDQETEDAWEQAFVSVSEIIKRPSKRLETEPLRGWGVVMLVACTYFTVVTPFRFAGFLYGHERMVILLNILDFLFAFVMFLDLMLYVIQNKLRLGNLRHEDRSNDAPRSIKQSIRRLLVPLRKYLVKKLESYRMDRWAPWYSLDIQVLLSFALQSMYIRTSICAQIGLHWTQIFGLMRAFTAIRVMHFLQCAENNALIDQKLSSERQMQLRVAKLLLRLAFMIHFAACMWCTVARIGLGVDATEFEPSSFFPKPDIIYGSQSDVFQSYSRAVHWAFVSLSGIGGVESEPTTTLEVWVMLIVHMIGAVFYAVITGNVIAILEEETKRENAIGADIIRLSSYLQTARVSEMSKDRIMKGFMMTNVLTRHDEEGANKPGNDTPDLNDKILSTLPRYLQMEVGIYARAELIHRRDKFFAHSSQGFLVALSSCLSRTRTLLPGDYLVHKGEAYVPEFVLVESGSLQVRHGHDTVKTLNRGDCLGKAWLLRLKNRSKDPNSFSEKTDWLLNNGEPAVSIRALTACTLLTGLSSFREIRQLERGYKSDFQLLRAEARESHKSASERKAIAVAVIARCVRRWKQRRLEKKLNGE